MISLQEGHQNREIRKRKPVAHLALTCQEINVQVLQKNGSKNLAKIKYEAYGVQFFNKRRHRMESMDQAFLQFKLPHYWLFYWPLEL